ncbi:phage portal protein [Camelimonas abortus]|uniref:Phage portal protein n=1 Tax=Camelimonas abortus TaxID=1017184 RepID=A0ABV7LF56_9HYPH
MAGLFARLLRRAGPEAGPAERRAFTPPAGLIAWSSPGRPAWSGRDYAAFAREGYQGNAIAHRCVRLVCEAVAATPLALYEGDSELERHPLLELLERPNPHQDGVTLIETVCGQLLVAGNAYLHAIMPGGAPRELHALRPDRVRVMPGEDGWPSAWEYAAGGRTVRFLRGQGVVSPVLHLRQFHPTDDYYGLSSMEAAARALDLHNAASAWNKALLDNAARPSGALVYAGPQGSSLTDAQFERLRAEMETQFQGVANAGRPLLLEGGLDWKPLSLSPKDMDFTEARAAAAREIALALGVPPLLLGLPGDNTYGNYAEANRAFWRQTVLPLARRIAAGIACWLGPAWGQTLRLAPDADAIEALASEREALWRKVSAATFLSDDEKRAAVGYGVRSKNRT